MPISLRLACSPVRANFAPPSAARSYLNQINTQSTLLASCATAMLASSELNAMEDEQGYFAWPLNGMYVMSTTLCLACSLFGVVCLTPY